ncbi:hypothetical protein [Natrialbaceae archaeon AArc-T1-2]|uniref:hypothetical protein n=1 Tax=Natrialbaceae archaeon AArc-T1-2 TaxID=3053904 RepID=UPI00255B0DC8|nr:hypothetical protein [Natrialbaceae archaeon AArc-T1-2]WIV67087.1 hypothetical protein QQ977_15585 [Natrialbaceae archaeon AArc-T1-2]
MHPLRSCDFCDADAVGTFELLPPELEPSEDEQRRVVLCADCKPRLEALLEPLLARAGAGSEDGGGDGDEDGRDRSNADIDDRTGESDAITLENDRSHVVPIEGDESDSNDAGTDDVDPVGDDGDDADAEDAGDDPSNGSDRPPNAYGKALRLLRNRELPMDRREFESLAAGAYDLGDHEAESIVDHALERGELVQDGTRLRRP